MTDNSKLENMVGSDSDNLISSNCHAGEQEKEGFQKISVSDHHVNGLQHKSMKSDSFVVDMDRFSHLIDKDINTTNSRFTLQRNLSRKGSGRGRGAEKKFDPAVGNERDVSMLTTSPNATLHGGTSTPEKPSVLTLGPTDQFTPQGHHQITITNGGISSPAAGSKLSGGRQSSFRSSQHSWALSPRRILLFFASLSSMGTILLIYFTLSMSKLNGDGSNLD